MNCEKAGINATDFCSYCRGIRSNRNSICWIEKFDAAIKFSIVNGTFKSELIRIITHVADNRYFQIALKEYPEQWSWYQKVLVLK